MCSVAGSYILLIQEHVPQLERVALCQHVAFEQFFDVVCAGESEARARAKGHLHVLRVENVAVDRAGQLLQKVAQASDVGVPPSRQKNMPEFTMDEWEAITKGGAFCKSGS